MPDVGQGAHLLCSMSLWSRVVEYLKQTPEHSAMLSRLQSDSSRVGRNNPLKIPRPTFIAVAQKTTDRSSQRTNPRLL
jgi:hypothetical protein